MHSLPQSPTSDDLLIFPGWGIGYLVLILPTTDRQTSAQGKMRHTFSLGKIGIWEVTNLGTWEVGRKKREMGHLRNWHAEKAKAQSFPTELLQVKQVTTLV